MSQALTIPGEIPDGLRRQLRIRHLRLETGQDVDLEYHPAAAHIAARMRAAIAPTTHAHVRKWMTDLTAGPVLPKDGPDLDTRIGATCVACSDFPAAVWSAESLKRGFQTFARFYPAAGEIYQFLKPDADRIMDVIVGLEAIAKAPVGLRAVPAKEPYVMPSVPDWVGNRGGLRRGRGDHTHPPLNIPIPPHRPDPEAA